MESIKNWFIDAANILFDDTKNDLRALPRTFGETARTPGALEINFARCEDQAVRFSDQGACGTLEGPRAG